MYIALSGATGSIRVFSGMTNVKHVLNVLKYYWIKKKVFTVVEDGYSVVFISIILFSYQKSYRAGFML